MQHQLLSVQIAHQATTVIQDQMFHLISAIKVLSALENNQFLTLVNTKQMEKHLRQQLPLTLQVMIHHNQDLVQKATIVHFNLLIHYLALKVHIKTKLALLIVSHAHNMSIVQIQQ